MPKPLMEGFLLRRLIYMLCWLGGCTPETNVNGALLGSRDRASVLYHLERGQAAYDHGDTDTALQHGEAAYALDPGSEDVALLLGYTHLSIAGIDAIKLFAKLKGKAASPSPTSSPNLVLADDSAGSTLASLADTLGMNANDLQNLTVPDNQKAGVSGAPASGIFRDYPVLLPLSAAAARESAAETVRNAYLAQKYICPFVEDEVKVLEGEGDPRHIAAECPPVEHEVENYGKLYFLWGFAHLIEAISFHKVVLYQPEGADKPNLIRRSEALQASASSGDLGAYISAVNDLAIIVDLIMPVQQADARDGMLTAMFNDFSATHKAFGLLAGMPKNVTDKIGDALSKLREQQNKIAAKQAATKTNTGAGANSTAGALKEQLTSGLAKNLATQIQAKAEAGQLSPEKQDQLCNAYKSIPTEPLATCNK